MISILIYNDQWLVESPMIILELSLMMASSLDPHAGLILVPILGN
jgi:hypothetical protein